MSFKLIHFALGLCAAAKSWARNTQPRNPEPDSSGTGSCNVFEPAPVTAAPKTNVWAQISEEDNLAVWKLLHAPETGLNLTDPGEASVTDNYVFWVDTVHTNKSNVLPYIDGDADPPAKFARAVIFSGGKDEPDSQEYMIGPLPVTAETKVEKLDYIYNGGDGGRIPYNARFFDEKRAAAAEPLLVSVMSNISDITEDLIGGSYFGMLNEKSNVIAINPSPVSYDGTQAFYNVGFRYPGDATYALPLDFYVIIDCPGTDPSHYSLRGIVTNTKYFETVKALRAAYEVGELDREMKQTRESDWALLDYKPELGSRDLESKLAPQSLEIGGKRYKVDEDNKYVEYMGWSFYIAFTQTLGIMFYDIKYKGQRILYELSVQEALAQYTGNQPRAANTVYHDTYFSLGKYAGTLLEGYDCPFGSTLWDLQFHTGNSSTTKTNALAIFESDSGYPLSRHRYEAAEPNDYGFSRFAAVKSSTLTTRTTIAIGNYDYMFDYKFNTDGSMEVVIRASGYLQSSAYYPEQGKFGPRIQQGTQGSFHDHVITYKADFDILDTSNSLQISELVVKNQSQQWFPELGEFEQIELSTSMMDTEKQFNWNPNNAAMYSIVNSNATNKWGEKRGYRIIPGQSNIHLTTMKSPFSLHQTPFSKSHLALTRQKDTEPYANSWQNVNLPRKPQQDFLKFFDGESVDGEDVVLWFNLGMHHYTRAEDIPVTLFTEAVSSIVFAPQNFNDRAEDGDILNRRWVAYNNDTGELDYEAYDVDLAQCSVKLDEPVLGIKKNVN